MVARVVRAVDFVAIDVVKTDIVVATKVDFMANEVRIFSSDDVIVVCMVGAIGVVVS